MKVNMTKTTSKYYLNLIQFISIGILLTFQNCSEPLPNLVSNINNTSENDSSNNLQTHLSDLKFKTTNQINGDLKTEFNIDESIYREVSPLGRDSLVCQTKIDNESACLNLNNFKKGESHILYFI